MQALRDMKCTLTPRGSNLSYFVFPEPIPTIKELDIERETFNPKIDISLHSALDIISRMNPRQMALFDALCTALTSASPAQSVFYFDGKATHGKSFVVSVLCT